MRTTEMISSVLTSIDQTTIEELTTISALPSITSRFFAIPEMLEATLLQSIIPVSQILTLQRTCKVFEQTIGGSLLLQRKVFARQVPTLPGGCISSAEIVLNDMFTPCNLGVDSFHTYWARKVRFSLPADNAHVYETHWATLEDYSGPRTVLCIEISKWSAIGKKALPKAFMESHLCDKKVGVMAMLKSEEEGEDFQSRLWVPGGVRFGKVLRAAGLWADGMMTEGSGFDGDGMYVCSGM